MTNQLEGSRYINRTEFAGHSNSPLHKVSGDDSWLYRPQFPESWNRCSLYSLAEWVNGIAFRKIQFSDSGKPVIKIAEIKNGISNQTKFTSDEFHESVHVQAGDMLFSWSGQPETSIGVFWWRGPEGWLNQHIFRVAPSSKVDRTFLYYLLDYLKPHFVGIARNKQTTDLGHITKQDLKDIEVAIPPLREQRAIARELSVLDDKIELNRNMALTLEEVAIALFKFWFVDFDPIHAKERGRWLPGNSLPGLPAKYYDLFPSSLMDSGLGRIPEGWKVGNLANVVELLRHSESPNLRPDDLYHHYSIPAYDQNKMPNLEFGSEIKSTKHRVYRGVVLVSKLNPEIECTWLIDRAVDDKSVCSTEFLVMNPMIPFRQYYVYCLLRSKVFRDQIQSLVTGTSKSHQRAQAKMVLSLPTLLPEKGAVEAFEESIDSVMQRSTDNIRSVQTLAAIRDQLLPELMAGSVAAKDV